MRNNCQLKGLMGLLSASGLIIQINIEIFRKYIDILKDYNVQFDLDKLIND